MYNTRLVYIDTDIAERYYKNYKYRYTMLTINVELLNFAIEQEHTYYIKLDAQRVIEETRQLDGYTECLYDIGFFSEDDLDKFWTFTQLIRLECKDLL